MSLLFLLLTVVTRGQSALDGFDPNANGVISVVVVQPDGKILLGGLFTTLSPNGGPVATRNHIARLNPDGTLDVAFNPNANNSVFAIAIQPDGKILAGGLFTSIGGQMRNFIARLDATTGLADSLDPHSDNQVNTIALQADGKILAGGDFLNIGGQQRTFITRLDATTGLADSFNANANASVGSIAVQANGKILVAGGFSSIGGQTRHRLARLDATTGLADSFDPNANAVVITIAVQADGKVLAGGLFTSIGGQTRSRIARLDATTGLADSFDPAASGFVQSIAVQADGKILVGGLFNGTNSIGGQTRNYIARLDTATGLADSFDPKANNTVYAIAVQADGKILAGGDFTTLSPNGGAAVTRNRIARLETDGRLDRTVDVNAVGEVVYATAFQRDGKILLGGRFTTVLGQTRHGLARLNTDGTLDTAFNPNVGGAVFTIAVQADGKILVGGDFSSVGAQTRHFIARIDSVTGLADSFDPDAAHMVFAIVVQPDGKILVGGAFEGILGGIGGQPRNRIARLDPVTGLADSFDPNAQYHVLAIALQPDGKILVGGEFVAIGGQQRHYIARLDATTGLADGFNPNSDGFVWSIAVQAGGKILMGGVFANVGGQSRHNVARLDGATGLADPFNPAADSTVYSIAVQADGRILAGGTFQTIGGQTRHGIARLDATTGLADSFDPNSAPCCFGVSSFTVQADGKILVGGAFANIGGQPRNLFARLSNDTAALRTLVIAQNQVTWLCDGASPQFGRVRFEFSSDNVTYISLGDGIPVGRNWTLSGLDLSTTANFYLRARGYPNGQSDGSGIFLESVKFGPAGTPSTTPTPGTLGNISTRLRVLSGDNALIGGLIATGTAGKRVIIRAIGPSLAPFGVPGALANPTLDLFQGSSLLFSNDDWNDSTQQAEIASTGLAPGNTAESAIIWTLTPGQGYTAVVRGLNGTTGIGVVEAFDLDPGAATKLGNISTRGFVDVDDNVMIAGLIAGPGNGTSLKILVRALGPTLSDFGVAGALANPTLELVNASGTVIRSNDNWKDDPQQRAAIEAAGLGPSHDEEAALVETVAPGAYTAVVRGSGGATGVGLVEAYNIP
jgi:uncharacterized delta-60 repeat protein